MGQEYHLLLKTDKTVEEIRQDFISLFSLGGPTKSFTLLGEYCNFQIDNYYDHDHDENGDDVTSAVLCPGATIGIWIYPHSPHEICWEERNRSTLTILNHYSGDFGAELASSDMVIFVRRNNILYYDDEEIDEVLIRESGYDMSRVVKGIPRQYQFRSFE